MLTDFRWIIAIIQRGPHSLLDQARLIHAVDILGVGDLSVIGHVEIDLDQNDVGRCKGQGHPDNI